MNVDIKFTENNFIAKFTFFIGKQNILSYKYLLPLNGPRNEDTYLEHFKYWDGLCNRLNVNFVNRRGGMKFFSMGGKDHELVICGSYTKHPLNIPFDQCSEAFQKVRDTLLSYKSFLSE